MSYYTKKCYRCDETPWSTRNGGYTDWKYTCLKCDPHQVVTGKTRIEAVKNWNRQQDELLKKLLEDL